MKPLRITPEMAVDLETLDRAMLDLRGREVLNPKGLMVRLGLKKPLTLEQRIDRLIRRSLSQQAQAQGMETFEEADDFDVGEADDEPLDTQYTMLEDEFPAPRVPETPPPPQKGGGSEPEPGAEPAAGAAKPDGGEL